MAVLDIDDLDLGGEFGDEAFVAGLFDAAVDWLSLLDASTRIRVTNQFERRLESVRLLAGAELGGSDPKRTRSALSDPMRSARCQSRDARRAAAMAANPSLADEVATGSISGKGVDALTRSADDHEQIPADLIGAAAGVPVDQANRIVGNYLADRSTREEANQRYAQQQPARQARRYTTTNTPGGVELAGLAIEGPDAVIDRLWNRLAAEADTAYRAAGGRDQPSDKHEPWAARLFDAAVASIDGTTTGSNARPAVVVTTVIDQAKPGHQAGTGPISDSLLAEYAARGDLFAAIVDLNRQPLWLGRARRHGSAAQFLALVVCDRGCVLCGVSAHRCDAHHLLPWEAPRRGTTDLENLALLCGSCHRRLHQSVQTLYWRAGPNGERRWRTRPATVAERSLPRPIQRE